MKPWRCVVSWEELEAEKNMRLFDSPDPGCVVVVDRSDHEPARRRCGVCFRLIPARRLQRFPHTALCGREACKLAHVRRTHTEAQRKYTLRRNMKQRDEELQNIQLSMSEIELSKSEIELSKSEIEQRLNTFSGYPPGYEGPANPFIGKPPPEVEALLTKRTDLETKRTDLEIRRAELVAEGEEEARLADEHNRTQKQDCP